MHDTSYAMMNRAFSDCASPLANGWLLVIDTGAALLLEPLS